LASLPWVAPDEAPKIREVDPLATRGPLPVPVRRAPSEPVLERGQVTRERDRKPALGESAPWVVRTALGVEPRDGRLHVFMPPVEAVEDYLDLVTAIEDTAAHLNMLVAIEGY